MGAIAVADRDEQRVSITEFARKVSQFVAGVSDEPITLTKQGRPVAVLISFEAYRNLAELEERAEDLYWTVVALRSYIQWMKDGFPTVALEEAEARARDRD